jgi:2'-5' RNA ligase
MSCGEDGAVPINCFALVTYIPEPLGGFLDRLRRDLIPGCLPRAHVTILPPRPVLAPTADAVAKLNQWIAELEAFEIEAREVEVFENTSVIHIGLGKGREELQWIHTQLNADPLEFSEPFPYHPHITLAQDFDAEQVPRLLEEAKRHWAQYAGPRTFPVETITFVQNTTQNRWIDLARWSLGAVPTVR